MLILNIEVKNPMWNFCFFDSKGYRKVENECSRFATIRASNPKKWQLLKNDSVHFFDTSSEFFQTKKFDIIITKLFYNLHAFFNILTIICSKKGKLPEKKCRPWLTQDLKKWHLFSTPQNVMMMIKFPYRFQGTRILIE